MAEPSMTDHTVFPSYPATELNAGSSSAAADAQKTKENVKDATQVNIEKATQAIVSNASAAYDTVANHPLTQNVKDTVVNGPVAQNAKVEAQKTQNEFANLAAARTTPSQPAATGQNLTHYHSFFSSLLSWENPRASAIAYIAVVSTIFACRYLNLLRYAFKLTWMTLGVTVAAEVAGQVLFKQGLTSQIRPRKYYVLPRETIDNAIGDVHELINFFVIESQRILFAENVYASAAVLVMAFLSYFLIKIVPLWGLFVIGTSVAFFAPLIYIQNKEMIDHHVRRASVVVSQQSEQIKQVATHHAAVAAETTKKMASDYTAKAQDVIGQSTQKAQEMVGPLKEKVNAQINTATAKAQDASAQVQNAASNAAVKTQDAASNAAAKTQETASYAAAKTQDTASNVANQASYAAQNAGVAAQKNVDAATAPSAAAHTAPVTHVPVTSATAYDVSSFPAAPRGDFTAAEARSVGATAPVTGAHPATVGEAERKPLLV